MQNLNGYRATHRNKWYFIQHGILSVQELALLEFYADLFCFNPAQPNFGTFTINFEEIANVFGCKSDTTIRNWHKRLLNIGFIEKTSETNVFKLVCGSRYIGPGFFKGEAVKYQEREKNQPIDTILQSFGIDFQSIGKNIQPIGIEDDEKADATAQTKSLATDSYKDSDTISPHASQKYAIIRQAVRSDVEYQKIYADGGYELLTTEDMRWIDEHLFEKIFIESESTTQIFDQKVRCASKSSPLENQPRKNSIGSDSKIDGHRAV